MPGGSKQRASNKIRKLMMPRARGALRSWSSSGDVRLAAVSYDRRRDLPRLVPMWPREIEDETREGRARLVRALRKALKAERRRGIAGHWAYDLARHVQLLTAYRIEAEDLRALGARVHHDGCAR